MSPASSAAPVLALMLNAFTWGVSWWPFRQLQAAGLHPLWATAGIYLLAVAGLLLLRPRALKELASAPGLWVVLLAAGATNASFNWAATVGDVVRVVLLFYLMPLWSALLARALLGERLDGAGVLRIALALLGAAIVLWPEAGLGGALGAADALAVLGGFTFALNNVMLRREATRSRASRAVAMFLGGAVVAGLLAGALTALGLVAPPPAPAAGWLALATVLGVAFVVSNLALQYGATRLPSQTTALVMLTEVVFATVSALALDGGEVTVRTVVGGALIVLAAGLAARRGAA